MLRLWATLITYFAAFIIASISSSDVDISLRLLRDLHPGPKSCDMASMGPSLLKPSFDDTDNDKDTQGSLVAILLFGASDGVHGSEVFQTDGTEKGTRLVADINPGNMSSNPEYKGRLKPDGEGGMDYDIILFSAKDPEHGRELWYFNSKEGTAQLVRDIWLGANSSNPSNFVKVSNHQLYFAAMDEVHHLHRNGHLWRTNGKTASKVTDDIDTIHHPFRLDMGGGNNLFSFQEETLFFVENLLDCPQIWTLTDGLFMDVCKDRLSVEKDPDFITNRVDVSLLGSLNDRLIFLVDEDRRISNFRTFTDVGNQTVWSVDPNKNPGNTLQKLVQLGTVFGGMFALEKLSRFPLESSFIPSQDRAILMSGCSIWITDGTTHGTQHLIDLYPDRSNRFKGWVNPITTSMNSTYIFIQEVDSTGPNGFDIWITDGTVEGTTLLLQIDNFNTQILGFVDLEGDHNGRALFTTETLIHPFASNEEDGMKWNHHHWNHNRTGSYRDYQVWVTNGSPETTKIVRSFHVPGSIGKSPCSPHFLREGLVLLPGYDPKHGLEPWLLTYGRSNTSRKSTLWTSLLLFTAMGAGISSMRYINIWGKKRLHSIGQETSTAYEMVILKKTDSM